MMHKQVMSWGDSSESSNVADSRKAEAQAPTKHKHGHSRNGPTSPGACTLSSNSYTDQLLKAFNVMHAESLEDWKDYVKRCGGKPVSKVRP